MPAGARKGGDLSAVATPELGQDVHYVGVDSALGDEQPLSDLSVGQLCSDQLGDLVLAPGERQVLLWMRCGFCGQPQGGSDPVSAAARPAGLPQGSCCRSEFGCGLHRGGVSAACRAG
jgi:hypothetical protein